MQDLIFNQFIHLTWLDAAQVVLLGFIGGILSGFIGSGGAFFMTPGMMNLNVPGVISVGSNITHKFGKALVGQKAHSRLGHVDRKLAVYMLATAALGIRIAVWINSTLFKGGADGHGAASGAAANLYISLVFVGILTVVAITMLRDALGKDEDDREAGPSTKIADFLGSLKLFPVIRFPVADVKVSLWVIFVVGLATGSLAGTIGVGGFIGVPAMIYVFGVPTAVAAGTELYLAMFMGAWGAINYAAEGLVDLRLTMLLYLGSLVGIHIGAYGTKVVREVFIRMVTGIIILLCVLSRMVAVPMYLRQLGYLDIDPGLDSYFNGVSKFLLFVAGTSGAGVILFSVLKAFRQRMSVRESLKFETGAAQQ
jgi:uncharacterized membrane protein YfcA